MILLYILFEKLHRYVYDYCYQSSNADWGKHTPYKEANKGNKLKKYNAKIEKAYRFLLPFLHKFRYKICLYFPKKYQRYSASKIKGITKYEVNKYYNFIDKIVLKYRFYRLKKSSNLKSLK